MKARFLLLILFSVSACIPHRARAQSDRENGRPLRYEEPRLLLGKIYAKDSASDRSRPLFTFKRTATREGDRLNILREFNYPDGSPAARERVVYEGDQLALYELEELQVGAHGKASLHPGPAAATGGRIAFEYNQKKTATATEPLRKDTLIADMIGPFLADHWETLVRGKEVQCRYIVLPRRETIGFTFVKVRQEKRRGREVVIVKMEPASALLSSLVDPLFFVIEKEGRHRVLEYTGRTTPKVRAGKKWRDLDAVSVFEWE